MTQFVPTGDPGFGNAPLQPDMGALSAFVAAAQQGFSHDSLGGTLEKAARYKLADYTARLAGEPEIDEQQFAREYSWTGLKWVPGMSLRRIKEMVRDKADEMLLSDQQGGNHLFFQLAGGLLGSMANPVDLTVGIGTGFIGAARTPVQAGITRLGVSLRAARSGVTSSLYEFGLTEPVIGILDTEVNQRDYGLMEFGMSLAGSVALPLVVSPTIKMAYPDLDYAISRYIGFSEFNGARPEGVKLGEVADAVGRGKREPESFFDEMAGGLDLDRRLKRQLDELDRKIEQAMENSKSPDPKIAENGKKAVDELSKQRAELDERIRMYERGTTASQRRRANADVIEDLRKNPTRRITIEEMKRHSWAHGEVPPSRRSGQVGKKAPEPDDSTKLISMLVKKISGRDVRFFDATDPATAAVFGGSEGRVSYVDASTIYVRHADLEQMLQIVGHELGHTLKHTRPDLWRSITTSIMSLDNEELRAIVRQTLEEQEGTPAWRDYSMAKRFDETMATAFGVAFRDPKFWSAMDPVSASQVMQYVQRLLNKLEYLMGGGRAADFSEVEKKGLLDLYAQMRDALEAAKTAGVKDLSEIKELGFPNRRAFIDSVERDAYEPHKDLFRRLYAHESKDFHRVMDITDEWIADNLLAPATSEFRINDAGITVADGMTIKIPADKVTPAYLARWARAMVFGIDMKTGKFNGKGILDRPEMSKYVEDVVDRRRLGTRRKKTGKAVIVSDAKTGKKVRVEDGTEGPIFQWRYDEKTQRLEILMAQHTDYLGWRERKVAENPEFEDSLMGDYERRRMANRFIEENRLFDGRTEFDEAEKTEIGRQITQLIEAFRHGIGLSDEGVPNAKPWPNIYDQVDSLVADFVFSEEFQGLLVRDVEISAMRQLDGKPKVKEDGSPQLRAKAEFDPAVTAKDISDAWDAFLLRIVDGTQRADDYRLEVMGGSKDRLFQFAPTPDGLRAELEAIAASKKESDLARAKKIRAELELRKKLRHSPENKEFFDRLEASNTPARRADLLAAAYREMTARLAEMGSKVRDIRGQLDQEPAPRGNGIDKAWDFHSEGASERMAARHAEIMAELRQNVLGMIPSYRWFGTNKPAATKAAQEILEIFGAKHASELFDMTHAERVLDEVVEEGGIRRTRLEHAADAILAAETTTGYFDRWLATQVKDAKSKKLLEQSADDFDILEAAEEMRAHQQAYGDPVDDYDNMPTARQAQSHAAQLQERELKLVEKWASDPAAIRSRTLPIIEKQVLARSTNPRVQRIQESYVRVKESLQRNYKQQVEILGVAMRDVADGVEISDSGARYPRSYHILRELFEDKLRLHNGDLAAASEAAAKDLLEAHEARLHGAAWSARARIRSGDTLNALHTRMDGIHRKGVNRDFGLSIEAEKRVNVSNILNPVLHALQALGDERLLEAALEYVYDIAHGRARSDEDHRLFKAFADSWKRANQIVVGQMNSYGGLIRFRDDFLFSQTHNKHRMEAVGYTEWAAYLNKKLDWHEVERLSGPNTHDGRFDRETWLRGFWDDVMNGRVDDPMQIEFGEFDPETDNLARRSDSKRRTVIFIDGAGAMEYDRLFGSGNPGHTAIGQLARRAERAVVMRHFGPEYNATFSSMLADVGAPADASLFSKAQLVKWTFQQLTGQLDNPLDPNVSWWGQNIRAAANLVVGWTATISSLNDIGNLRHTLKTTGMDHVSREIVTNLIEATKDPQVREFLQLQGAGLTTLMGNMARMDVNLLQNSGFAKWANDLTFTYNGMKAWSRGIEMTYAHLMIEHLGDMATNWRNNPQFAEWRKTYGISDDDWVEIAKSANKVDGFDKVVLAPSMVENPQLRRKLQVAFQDTMGYALIQPSVSEQALLRLGTRAGTPFGEAVRLMTQYKGFPLAMTNKMRKRFAVFGGEGGRARATVEAAAWVGSLLFLGWLSTVIKDLLSGKEPLHFMQEEQWTYDNLHRLINAAGILGPLGDLSGTGVLGPAPSMALRLANNLTSDDPRSAERIWGNILNMTPGATIPVWSEFKHWMVGAAWSDAYEHYRQSLKAWQESETGQSSIYGP